MDFGIYVSWERDMAFTSLLGKKDLMSITILSPKSKA